LEGFLNKHYERKLSKYEQHIMYLDIYLGIYRSNKVNQIESYIIEQSNLIICLNFIRKINC